jgi:hypothetical protein
MLKSTILILLLAAAVFGAAYMRTVSVEAPAQSVLTDARSGRALVPEGLAAYYPLNGNAEDASGFGRSGVIVGAVPAPDRHGAVNAALEFNGRDAYVQVPPVVSTEKFSVSVWVKGSRVPKAAIFYQGLHEWILLNDEQGRVSFGVKLTDGLWYLTTGREMPDSWTHIAGTYDRGESIRLFMNGVPVDTLTSPPALEMNSTAFGSSIGAVLGGATDFYPGTIDELRIYSRILTPDEIAILWRERPVFDQP